MHYGLKRGEQFFSVAHSTHGVALIGHALHFSYSEIMGMDVGEYKEYLKIAKEILEAKA
ncbi:hypothetical protein CHL_0390 [Campylobacter hyointestinalis subsp. lawsonii CCUG 27631]|uniref:hypothetical protein n=1 Tax=Campylobacter hyointestinalis TaxID=198 RepID=UPI0007C9C124|nr:hypothetical protein [Campylobacter hyointestinalis]ANE33766.1 hypothetical protein CHL_0390 [Campylobacter hyointestinalis subsp. lawsonii CCUG 27631]